MQNYDDKRSIAIKASDQNGEIDSKNGLQILAFSRSLQTGKMSSSSRNGGRQTREMSGHVTLSVVRGKKYAVLNLSNDDTATADKCITLAIVG